MCDIVPRQKWSTYIRMRVPITTTIDQEQYKLIKKNNWRVPDLIDLGIGAKISPDVAREKMNEYEFAQKNLMNTIRALRERLVRLEDNQMGFKNEDTDSK